MTDIQTDIRDLLREIRYILLEMSRLQQKVFDNAQAVNPEMMALFMQDVRKAYADNPKDFDYGIWAKDVAQYKYNVLGMTPIKLKKILQNGKTS